MNDRDRQANEDNNGFHDGEVKNGYSRERRIQLFIHTSDNKIDHPVRIIRIRKKFHRQTITNGTYNETYGDKDEKISNGTSSVIIRHIFGSVYMTSSISTVSSRKPDPYHPRERPPGRQN